MSRPPNSIPSHVGPFYPMVLIVMSLFVMVGMGMETNSLQNSGLINLSNPTPSYSCTIDDYLNCAIPIETGCQASGTNCQIGGSQGLTSLFNANSPFTAMFSGNPWALLSSLTGTPVNTTPFGIIGGGNYYPVSCILEQTDSSSATPSTIEPLNCTQIGSDNQNLTYSAAASLPVWSPTDATITGNFSSVIRPLNVFTNATTGVSADNSLIFSSCDSWYQQASLVGIPYGTYFSIYYGCENSLTVNSTVYLTETMLFATQPDIQSALGADTNATVHANLLIQSETWNTAECAGFYDDGLSPTLAQKYGSPQCTAFSQQELHPVDSFVTTVLMPFLGIIFGIFLVLLGTGLNFRMTGTLFGSGTTIAAGVNAQGTRLAQVMGIGLLVWSVLFSEFGPWITSPLLASTGLSVLMGFVITGLFFVGVFWQTLSWH